MVDFIRSVVLSNLLLIALLIVLFAIDSSIVTELTIVPSIVLHH